MSLIITHRTIEEAGKVAFHAAISAIEKLAKEYGMQARIAHDVALDAVRITFVRDMTVGMQAVQVLPAGAFQSFIERVYKVAPRNVEEKKAGD